MLNLYITVPLALAIATQLASGTAVPVQWGCPKGQVKYTTEQNANFDDLTGLPGVPLASSIPTPYKGIFYQAFGLVQAIVTNLAPGLLPKSGKNYAATGVGGQTLHGTSMMTLTYTNSDPNVKEFAMESFAYGCTLNLLNDAADPPQPCTVVFTGYNGQDNTVAQSSQVRSQTFTYNPTTITGPQNMASTGPIKSTCKGLTHGTFSFVPIGGNAATASLLALSIDDVKYNLSGCKKA